MDVDDNTAEETMDESTESTTTTNQNVNWPGRWNNLKPILERHGPMAPPDFTPGPHNMRGVEACRILIIGAGGLGCELLKDLAMMAFRDLHVIDMDTIDTSNLNRQFLFRDKDVGRPKAEVAAEVINRRVPGCRVVPHYCQIQDKDAEFYKGFNIVVSGLDSVVARRWINNMLVGLLDYDDDGNVSPNSIIPLIDGGTEGFKGNARVIYPGMTACVECTLNLYTPQVNFPMCTIAHTPRLPEHCIEYARVLLWPKEHPFGEDVQIDGDSPQHVQWILEKALKRAEEFGIRGVTYRLTQGVIKHIIPAVASTNAVIAGICALEVFKLATNCAKIMNNYMNYQDADGIYAGVVEMEKNEDCAVCSRKPNHIKFTFDHKLEDVWDYLMKEPKYQMRSPAIKTAKDTLYFPNIPDLEKKTKPNLKKTLKELGLHDGQYLHVADATSPNTLDFILQLTPSPTAPPNQ